MGARADYQIGAVARRPQIGLRCTPPAAPERCRLVVAASFLLGTVEIAVARNAGLHTSLQDRIGQLELRRLIADIQWTADPMILIGAAGLIFSFLEERQDGIPVPALAATLTPFIVVAVIATNVHHAIDRAGTAQRLATR